MKKALVLLYSFVIVDLCLEIFILYCVYVGHEVDLIVIIMSKWLRPLKLSFHMEIWLKGDLEQRSFTCPINRNGTKLMFLLDLWSNLFKIDILKWH